MLFHITAAASGTAGGYRDRFQLSFYRLLYNRRVDRVFERVQVVAKKHQPCARPHAKSKNMLAADEDPGYTATAADGASPQRPTTTPKVSALSPGTCPIYTFWNTSLQLRSIRGNAVMNKAN